MGGRRLNSNWVQPALSKLVKTELHFGNHIKTQYIKDPVANI